MKLYATLKEYAKESWFSEVTAKRRLKDGILEKIESEKGGVKSAWYVDIYEANLYFANRVMLQHLWNKEQEKLTTFWKAFTS